MTDPTAARERTTCRICASRLIPVLSLGRLHLSDFPRSPTTVAHPAVPLDLARCENPACGLVQLCHTTPPAWLYGGTYWYRSGTNETMRAELHDIVQEATARVSLPAAGAIVMDIGANDGTLLAQYPVVLGPGARLCRVAYEPAASHYEALRPHATVLYPDYFKVDHWDPTVRARVITAIAMFYDLDDPHQFVAGLAEVLHRDGVLVIQQAYLLSMLAATDLTNICHEHLEYYHLAPLEALLAAHGLEVVDVAIRAINGGSIRTYIQHKGVGKVSPRVAQQRAEEARVLEHRDLLFQTFHDRALGIKAQLHAVVEAYRQAGAQMDLYAASTKANTLLQWVGLDQRHLRRAWERTPEKIGRYVGVSGIPIVSEAEGRQDPPAALLVGAWQFRDAFIAREGDYLRQGGRLLFPLPYVESVEQGRLVGAAAGTL